MRPYAYRDGVLHAEGVSVAALAEAEGTPLYCMSAAALTENYRQLDAALAGCEHEICFAPKANGSLAVLCTLARLGAGADAVSEGEIRLALAAGIPPERIVFEGPGKTRRELEFALAAGVGQINVESAGELAALAELARHRRYPAGIGLRVNPDVESGGHDKISTGRAGDKFGIAIDAVPALYARAAALPGLRVVGVSMHIGSQVPALNPFRRAFRRLGELVLALRAAGQQVERIDIGGGVGVDYGDGQPPPPVAAYGELVRAEFAHLDARIVVEPGRFIAAGAGILIARILRLRRAGGRRLVIVDAAMNDLLRPTLYDAHHPLLPVREPDRQAAGGVADVVGPVCETGDVLARGRNLPPLAEGELVAFGQAGAYAAAMASEYNARPRIGEVMVSGARAARTRARATYAEMLARERLPEWLPAA